MTARDSRYASGTSLEPTRREMLADRVEARLGELRGEPGDFDVGDALHRALSEKLSVADLKALAEALRPSEESRHPRRLGLLAQGLAEAGVPVVQVEAAASVAWPAVRELVMQWCQDDGTNDQLMDLVESLGFDPSDPDAFWQELDRRLALAFGAWPKRGREHRKSRARGG